MKLIKLNGLKGSGKFAKIDDEDFERVSRIRWHYGCKRYAVHHALTNKKQHFIYMHKFVLGVENAIEVDHINGDSLDNQKSNLRTCTHQQNMANKRMQKNNKSGIKGVAWDKNRNKWKATISFNDKTINLGRYNDKLEAAKVYQNKAKELFG